MGCSRASREAEGFGVRRHVLGGLVRVNDEEEIVYDSDSDALPDSSQF